MFFEGKDDKPEVVVTKPDEVKTYSGTDVIPSETVPKKPKRRLGLFLSLLALLVGLAFLAGFMLRDSAANKASAPGVEKTPVAKSESTKPSTDIAAMLREFSENLQGSGVTQDTLAPDYIVPGYDFASPSNKEDSQSVTFKRATESIEDTMTKLENNLVEKGFKKSAVQVKQAHSGLVKYENHDTICGLSNDGPDLMAGGMDGVYLACAPKSSYVETAKVQKPFYVAYRASEESKTGFTSLGYPRIADSRTRGYRTAEVNLYSEGFPTGAAGLFYQTPDQKWHFFRGTQQQLFCSDYTTEDLKKAYQNERCWDGEENQESFVQ